MGMCLGMTVSHPGLTLEAMQELFPEHKGEMYFSADTDVPQATIDVESTYSWCGVLQDRMWDYVKTASANCSVTLTLSDYEEPDDTYTIKDGVIIQHEVERRPEDDDDDEEPEALDEGVEYGDLPADQEAFHDAYEARLFNKCKAMMDDRDFDVFIEYEDCIQYIRVHSFFDDDPRNPLGECWDINEYTIFSDNEVKEYDAGALWGYVSAVEAADDNLGLYKANPIAAYKADYTELAWQMEDDPSELTFEEAKRMLHGYPVIKQNPTDIKEIGECLK